ncbi:MAG: alpha-hydroxy acid oxidase [Rugosibacter sp.]|nr:alpha-hydroxy acid oxidase [Rugosibacter sp.]
MAAPAGQTSLPLIDRACDYQPLAEARLDPGIWHYLQAGSSDASVTDTQNAFSTLRVIPRPLRNVQGGHTRLTLYGQELAHPLLLAPVSYQRLFHADGECASAMAASAQGSQMLVSSLASQPFEAIAQAYAAEANNEFQTDNPAQRPWFQLYWQGNRERTARLLRRVTSAGFSAIAFTIDAPIKRATLQLPADISAVNLENYPLPKPANPAQSQVFDGWMAQAPTWDDVAWLRQQTPLPLLLKGILHPDDAEHALALGCDGIVVSSHGGRVLDGAPTSLEVLPDIVQRIDGRMPILFDSGIRSGRDAFIALALGATAVLVGRPYLWGLTVGGALGVAHVIRLLRDELEMTMALTGCAQLGDIGRHCLIAR